MEEGKNCDSLVGKGWNGVLCSIYGTVRWAVTLVSNWNVEIDDACNLT